MSIAIGPKGSPPGGDFYDALTEGDKDTVGSNDAGSNQDFTKQGHNEGSDTTRCFP